MHAVYTCSYLYEQHNYYLFNMPTIICTSDMKSKSILSWLVFLLSLATITRSDHEHYHIVPVGSIDLCYNYRNGTCFTLKQLVQTDLLSGGDNLTLSFLPGDHVLTEQLLIRNFSHVQITGQNTSTTVIGFHSNGTICFDGTATLNIEHLGFVGANFGPQNFDQSLIIYGAHDIYINNCYFMDFKLLDQVETHIVKITKTQTATIESTLFMNNTGRALHVEADNVYITNSEFTRNDGGAVDVESNNVLINNTEFNYNTAKSGGAVEVISSTIVITWCNFTNNEAFLYGGAIYFGPGSSVSISDSILTSNRAEFGGAIHIWLGSVFMSNCTVTNNMADVNGGAISGNVSSTLSISDSILTNNRADYGGAIDVYSCSVSISDSELTNNSADKSGGVINVDSGSVSISDSILTSNRAEFGGVIDVWLGSVFMSNCTVTNNMADGNGGAIHCNAGSTVSISDSTLTKNKAHDYGGAIDVYSCSVSISDSELTNNSAGSDGGAIGIYTGGVSISNSTLSKNKADYGGAIRVSSGNVSILDSTLSKNEADYGGAISIFSDTVSISDSTLKNNSADKMISVDLGSVSISDSILTSNRAEFGGVIDVWLGSVVMSNCTVTNNMADVSGGAIHCNAGSTVSISESTLTKNRANNYGGAIDVYSCSVSISDSELTNNSAGSDGGAIGIYTGGVSISNSTLSKNKADYGGAIRVSLGNVSISYSTLSKNEADYGGAISIFSGTVSISDSTLKKNSADHNGGAIRIFASSSVCIYKSTLTNNRAAHGGGMIHVYSSSVSFSYSTLTNNRAEYGGAIVVYSGSASVSDSTLTHNTADGSGGALYGNLGSTVSISNSTLKNNIATYGGGIFLRVSTLFVNEAIEIYHNTAKNGGGIYADSSKVEFQSALRIPANIQSEITDNIAENGGGIYAVATTIKLTQSHVNIDSNTATANGGGVFLQQSSKLYLFKKEYEDVAKRSQNILVTLLINNNSAQYGGGIFVADDTESGPCRGRVTETGASQTIFDECFIQTINVYGFKLNINYFNTFMTNNTATQSGADIYGGVLDRCTVSINTEYQNSLNGLDYINKTVKSSTELSISSLPVQVIFCNYSKSEHVLTRKGHTIKISVMAVDQIGNPVNAAIQSSVVSESGVGRLTEGQTKQEVGNQCTELTYNVFSKDSSAQVELYAKGPCINLGISKQFFNIYFLPCTCPIGLKPILSQIECKCDCDPLLQQGYQIGNCSEKNDTIKLESNIWIRVANTTNGTGYVVSNCTFDYCVEKPVIISLSNPDDQCAFNRSGVLCGECKPGLSLVLATSNCQECSNLYLLLVIPFALAGILLVALILVLNITIATGNIHGLIFYANILAANKVIFFPNLYDFLTIFVSWLNLDLGIEICFYDGMNSQAKVLLQLVFPAYLFLLMFLVIILSKYIDSFAKLLSNRNPVAALGTLIVLSYSKLLRFIIAALRYRVLDYPDGRSDIVWLYDGNVQYFTPDHIPRFVAVAIILIAGGLFTVVLFFGQWFPRCSNVMKWTRNTKYIGFMDAYHAPFTPKHRYWMGLLLFALIAHNLVTAMAPDTYLPILSSGVLSVGLIGWKLFNNRLYKNTFCGSLETLYLLNVTALAFATFYVKDIKKNQSALANTSLALSFTLFVITLCYHFYQFVLKKSNTWLKVEDTIRKLGAGAADMRLRRTNNVREMYQLVADENDDNELLEAVDDYDQRDPVDPPYTDEAVEKADPDRYITPPIIRPATRPDQLRLSYMDELAPLTTEDYRPAPPPIRVNHRPAVTHTEIGLIRNEV